MYRLVYNKLLPHQEYVAERAINILKNMLVLCDNLLPTMCWIVSLCWLFTERYLERSDPFMHRRKRTTNQIEPSSSIYIDSWNPLVKQLWNRLMFAEVVMEHGMSCFWPYTV